MIAVIAALPQETQRLVRRYNLQRVHKVPAVYEDPESEVNFYVVVSGVGRNCASDCCRYIFQARPPESIVSVGFAGGLDPALCVADAVISKELIAWNGQGIVQGAKAHHSNPRLVDEAKSAAKAAGLFVHAGTTLQADVCLGTPEMKAAAREATGALAVDMESHAIAAFAEEHALPFLAVRFISDAAGDCLTIDPASFVRDDGTFSMKRTLKYFARNPRLLPEALRLQSATARCEENLVRFMENFRPAHNR